MTMCQHYRHRNTQDYKSELGHMLRIQPQEVLVRDRHYMWKKDNTLVLGCWSCVMKQQMKSIILPPSGDTNTGYENGHL